MIIAFTYNCCYNVTHRHISSIIPGWFLWLFTRQMRITDKGFAGVCNKYHW